VVARGAIFLSSLTFCLATCGGPPGRRGAGAGDQRLEFAGAVRTYRLHVPASRSRAGPGLQPRPAPLVLVFHGDGGDGGGVEALTGLSAVADREGFFVAYPDSPERHWNDDEEAGFRHPDDVGFVRALIARLAARHGIDRARIYATGFSNGGFFAQRLACEMAGEIAAVAAVAGTMSERLAARCRPEVAMPVLMIHGTADSEVPYHGAAGSRKEDEAHDLSVPAAVRHWVRADRCTGPPSVTLLPDAGAAGGRLRREAYTHCAAGAEVVLYDVEGGGHAWPGGSDENGGQRGPGAASAASEKSTERTAGDLIWEFFARHRRTVSSRHGTVAGSSPR
jgi:polyhydroxybutyrate depolymerase